MEYFFRDTKTERMLLYNFCRGTHSARYRYYSDVKTRLLVSALLQPGPEPRAGMFLRWNSS